MTYEEADDIIFRIVYGSTQGVRIEHLDGTPDPEDPGLVRIVGERDDIETGELELQNGRKWPLSRHMVESEVVQTVFMAIAVWEEHERRENFTYLGQKVFSPRLNLGQLATALRLGALTEQVRKDPERS